MSWQDAYYQQQIEKGKYKTFETGPGGHGVVPIRKVVPFDRWASQYPKYEDLNKNLPTYEEVKKGYDQSMTKEDMQSERGTSYWHLLEKVRTGEMTMEEMGKIMHEKAQAWRFKNDEDKKSSGGWYVGRGRGAGLMKGGGV